MLTLFLLQQEFRASVTEYRLHGTKHRWHEVEFTSKLLHARLESIVESRRVINRVEVSAIVGRFIEWSASVVKDIGTEVLPEKVCFLQQFFVRRALTL